MDQEVDLLVKDCQSGNLASFGVLFDQFNEKIYRFLYFRTHHKETAEDITAEVFRKALENIKGFNRSKASFSTWLYQIARNALIDHYRTLKPKENIEDGWDIAVDFSPEADLDAKQQLEKVWKYLQTLPKQQRDIVLMRVWDGMSHKEIAEVLGISESNSKMIFSRTLAKLNKEAVFAVVFLLILQLWNNK